MRGDFNGRLIAAAVATALFYVTVTAQLKAGDGMIWASEVTQWTDGVQNYGLYGSPELMTDSTTWWLTGAPDADQNGNGYAWDDGIDLDTVAGWRSSGMEQFTVRFDQAILDGAGADLLLVSYGGPNAVSFVWASSTSNDDDYVLLGDIGGGNPGYLEESWFDFGGLVNDVSYIRVVREVDGANSARFFDAIGGVAIPAPACWTLLGLAGVMTRRNRR